MLMNIENEIKIDKDNLLSQLNRIKDNYSNYIKTYIASDGDNLGYKKIINTLKNRFFNENKF